jgi:hypothetical protein
MQVGDEMTNKHLGGARTRFRRCAMSHGVRNLLLAGRAIFYTSDGEARRGEARQEFTIALTARPLSRHPTPSRESSEVR